MTEYGYKVELDIDFKAAIEKTKQELKKQGFGVLSEIDVKATLKKKLNVDYDNYIILGACNPEFAYKALKSEKDVGLLLPCNVIIYENQGKVVIVSIKPTIAMQMIDNANLAKIAAQVEEKLINVINKIK